MALWLSGRSALLSKLRLLNSRILETTTTSSTRSPTAAYAAHLLEKPIISVTDSKNVDLIGPAHPVSNLRPIVRRKHMNETELQQTLRNLQDATQEWNQSFWADHNTRFIQERKEFVTRMQVEKGSTEALSAEEMSDFYKQFLDKNWNSHLQYNAEWYKRNLLILLLSLWAALPPNLHFVPNVNYPRD